MDVEINIGYKVTNILAPHLHEKVGMMLARSFAFHLPRALGRELPPQLAQYVYRYVAPRSASGPRAHPPTFRPARAPTLLHAGLAGSAWRA